MLAALFLANCDATHQLQAISAGQTGCAPDDIEITDDEPGFNSRSWVAWCNSERYQCFGARNTISCKAAAKPSPVARSDSAPPKRSATVWVEHDVQDCDVTAEFPSEPKEESHEQQTKAGPIKISSAMTELDQGRGAFSVSCSVPLTRTAPVSVVLDGARDGMLKNIDATLREEHEIIGGREVLFERHGEQGLTHLLWLNHRMVLAIAMPLSAIGPRSARRFVNSVQLSEKR